MAKGKSRIITNRNQVNMADLSPILKQQQVLGTPKEPEKQDLYLKSLAMMLLEEHKKDINKSLKNTGEHESECSSP